MSPERDYAEFISTCEHGDYNLFKRLRDTDADDFNLKVLRRYRELRKNYLATDNILQRFRTYLNEFKTAGADQREYARWSGDSDVAGHTLDFDDEMDYLTDWITRRMNYLDTQRFEVAEIELATGKTMTGYSYDKTLDFSSVTNAKAWIATGYLPGGKVMLCRVNIVPANTGFVVTSDTPGAKIEVPVSNKSAYYSNLLIPVLERQTISGTQTIDGVAYIYMGIGTLSGTDRQGFVKINGTPSYGPNRCLLQVPTEYVASAARAMGGLELEFDESDESDETASRELSGINASRVRSGFNAPAQSAETAEIQLGTGKTMLGYSYDKTLDFSSVTNGKAWIATGYLPGGKVMLCRINIVPANTGFVVSTETPGDKLEVPFSDLRAYYASLLIPVLDRQTIYGTQTIDGVDYTYMGIGTLSDTGKQGFVKINGSTSYGPNRCLLQVPTEYVSSSARSIDELFLQSITVDAELSDDATRLMDNEQRIMNNDDGAIYDLQGRRVQRSSFNAQRSTLKPGLYIKGEKKILVK